jgi:hypothetical protein
MHNKKMTTHHLTQKNTSGALFLFAGLALCCLFLLYLMPPVPQNSAYHRFADTRTIWGLPHFFNVISNILILLVGGWGIITFRSKNPIISKLLRY